MAAEGQSDKMASDMEVQMKQRCVAEFLHVEKMAPTDIHWLNIFGDQTNVHKDQRVDVSTVRQWVMCFSSGDSKVKDKIPSGWPCTAVTPWNDGFRSAHLHKSVGYNQGTVYKIEYQLQCIGNDGGTLECCKVWPRWVLSHTQTERTPYASLSGPIAPVWAEGDSFLDCIITGDEMWCYHCEM